MAGRGGESRSGCHGGDAPAGQPDTRATRGHAEATEAAVPGAAEESWASHGVVVVYAPDRSGYACTHERVTRTGIAERLAALKGLDFAGDYDPSRRYPGPVYFVPSDTLVGIEAARALGIYGEHDLFGGVVPYPFVATKAITHPLVAPDAYAPAGWSREFERRVHDAAPSGAR